MNETQRRRQGGCREVWVREVAARLRCQANAVNAMVRTAAAVRLLSDSGNAGALGWHAILELGRLVARPTRRLRRTLQKVPDDQCLPSERETWEPRALAGTTPQAVFRRAVAEEWTTVRAKEEVSRLLLGMPRTGPRPKPSAGGEDSHGPPSLLQIAKNAAPADLVEMIEELVHHSTNPALVAEDLRRRLAAYQRRDAG